MSDGLPDDEYIAGDPGRSETAPKVLFKSESIGHPYWRALTGNERIVVMRWLKHGDASRLILTLAHNPSSMGLRAYVAEGLAGGPQTGWRMRLAARGPSGGAPLKCDRVALVALRDALAVGGGDVSMLAAQLAGGMTGERARRGPVSDPMQAAMVGIAYYAARGDMDAEKARGAVHRLYGLSLGDDNIQRLITQFNKAGSK